MSKGLNDVSAAYYTQWTKINNLISNPDNAAAIASIVAVAEEVILWNTAYGNATDFNNKANAGTAGITKEKNVLKTAAAVSASGQSGKGVSYAIKAGSTELKTQMKKLTKSYLNRTPDPDLAGVIQSIDDTLRPFLTSDPVEAVKYFTVVSLDAMMADRKAFSEKLGKYAVALGSVNGAKSDIIKIQKPIMEEIILSFSGFMNDLYASFPDFVNSFRAITKKLDTIGKRNQGITIEMVDAVSGLPLGLGGLAAITNYPPVKKAKIEKTNAMGVVSLMKLKIGVWKTKFSFPGYITQLSSVTIVSRKIVALKLLMVPVPPPPI